MKKYSILFGTVLAAMSFVACQKEVELVENPVNETTKSIPFVLKADVPEMATRTTLDPSTWALEWENGDIIYAVTVDGEWGVPFSQDSGTESIAEFVYDSSSNSFATSKTITADDHTFNFIYSNGKQKSFHRSDATTNQLSASQTMTAGDDATKQLKQYDAMAAQLTVRTPTQFANIQMSHLYTLMKVTLKNRTGNAITVNKFEMTAPNAVLATIFTVTFGETPSITPKADQTTYDRITVDITDGNIAAGADMPVYFIMAPLSAYNGDITFKATTSDNQTFTKTNTVSSLSFEAGAYNTASFTLKTADAPEAISYDRVTSLDDLTTGDYVILGEKSANSWGFFSYGTIDKNGRLPYTEVYTSLPAKIDSPNNNSIWHITVSGNGVTLYNASNDRYLKVNSGGKFGAWTSKSESATAFTVSTANNLFGFAFEGDYLGVNKNTDQDYWRCYAASTLVSANGLALYKKGDPNAPETSVEPTSKTWAYNELDSQVFAVSARNCTWDYSPKTLTWATITADASGITVTPNGEAGYSADNTATITVSFTATHTGYPAIAPVEISLTQTKAPAHGITVNPSTNPIVLGGKANTPYVVTVISNYAWSATTTGSGFVVTPTSGAAGETTVTIKPSNNGSDAEQTLGSITFTDAVDNTTTAQFTVKQAKTGGDSETMTFSDLYSSNTILDGVTISATNFSVLFNKRSGGTATQYYTNGTSVRWYGGGTLTVSAASGKTITGIRINYTQTANSISASTGTYKLSNSVGTWTHTSGVTSVTFTQSGTTGQCRIESIEVDYN